MYVALCYGRQRDFISSRSNELSICTWVPKGNSFSTLRMRRISQRNYQRARCGLFVARETRNIDWTYSLLARCANEFGQPGFGHAECRAGVEPIRGF